MELPKEYAMVHMGAATKAQEPIVIKGNAEGLCVLINPLVSLAENNNRSETLKL